MNKYTEQMQNQISIMRNINNRSNKPYNFEINLHSERTQ